MNYKHLYYFCAVVRAGSIAKASEQLHLTPQTLSSQIKQLEGRLGKPLLRKAGRGLEPTDAGRTVQRYADEIFSLGDAIKHALQSGGEGVWQASLRVGVVDSVPKSIACHLLEPCMPHLANGKLVCQEGKLDALLGDLAIHRLDVVISDVPLPGSLSVKAYTHLLGRTGTTFFAGSEILRRAGSSVKQARATFPACLQALPLLMPSTGTALRPRIDSWLRAKGLSPHSVAEFDDAALSKAFGRQGLGVFAGPTVLEAEIASQYDVAVLGSAGDVIEEFYAISIERRISHPAISAITAAARGELFH